MATNGTAAGQLGDQRDVQERVNTAADYVEQGFCDLDDVESADGSNNSDDEFRSFVREELQARRDEPESVSDSGPEETITSARGVDWDALWEEFNFDTANSVGSMVKSSTKVEEALKVTEQPVVADPDGILSDAVSAEILLKKPHGYVLVGGAD